jgi:hypothetical protein
MDCGAAKEAAELAERNKAGGRLVAVHEKFPVDSGHKQL